MQYQYVSDIINKLSITTLLTAHGVRLEVDHIEVEKGAILIRRIAAISGLLALVLGFLMGSAVPQHLLPWGVERVEQSDPAQSVMAMDEQGQSPEGQPTDTAKNKPAQQDAALNPKENFPLLNTACAALRTIQRRDFKALAAYVDGSQGLTFTSFSTVDREVDLTFTADQVAGFTQKTDKYNWGVNPETHEALNMTPEQYFSTYMYGVDYTQASQIGVDKINIVGNALENVTEAYPGCRFVEFTFPGLGSGTQRQEWSSLKLVFTLNQNQWKLVGLIHSQWTV